MALGTNRINTLVPENCVGKWGHTGTDVFGFTIYDLAGGAIALTEVVAFLTSPTGVQTLSTVFTAAAFVAPWNGAGSAYDAGKGVLTVEHAIGLAAGTKVVFRVQCVDAGANDSYMSFEVGIGDPPNLNAVPDVGSIVRGPDNRIYRIESLVGAVGSMKFRCRPTDGSVAGVGLFPANEITTVPVREVLRDSITVSQ